MVGKFCDGGKKRNNVSLDRHSSFLVLMRLDKIKAGIVEQTRPFLRKAFLSCLLSFLFPFFFLFSFFFFFFAFAFISIFFSIPHRSTHQRNLHPDQTLMNCYIANYFLTSN
jgi:hypothetical protein